MLAEKLRSELEELKSSNGSVTEEMEALSSRLKMALGENAEISQKEAQLQGIVKEVGVLHCVHNFSSANLTDSALFKHTSCSRIKHYTSVRSRSQ